MKKLFTPQRPSFNLDNLDENPFLGDYFSPQVLLSRDIQRMNIGPASKDKPNIVKLKSNSEVAEPTPIQLAFHRILGVEWEYYIDRSIVIYYFYNQFGKHAVLELPCKWGKDVTLNTIMHFFNRRDAYTPEEEAMRHFVFLGNYQIVVWHSGLNITKVISMMPYYGKYFVICIDWKYFDASTVENFYLSGRNILRRHFQKYTHVLTPANLNEGQMKIFNRYLLQENLNNEEIYMGFNELSNLLALYSQQGVIILMKGLDELLKELKRARNLENYRLIKGVILKIFTFTLHENPFLYKSLIVTSDAAKIDQFIKGLEITRISCLTPQYLPRLILRNSDVELLLKKACIPRRHWQGLVMHFDGYYPGPERLYPPYPVLTLLKKYIQDKKNYSTMKDESLYVCRPNFSSLVRASQYEIRVPLVSQLMKKVLWARNAIAALAKSHCVIINDSKALTIEENMELNNWARDPCNDNFLKRGADQWFYKLLLRTGLLTSAPDPEIPWAQHLCCYVPNENIRHQMLSDLRLFCIPAKHMMDQFKALSAPVCDKLDEIVLAATGRSEDLPAKIEELKGPLRNLLIGCYISDSRMPRNTADRVCGACERSVQSLLFACLYGTRCAKFFQPEYPGGEGPRGRPGRADLFFESVDPPLVVCIELKCNSETARHALRQIAIRQYDREYATKADRLRMGLALWWGQTQKIDIAYQLIVRGEADPAQQLRNISAPHQVIRR